jgi:hypothetical protein
MSTLFKSSSNFPSLSLKDLLEARDLFHYHLMNKENVVATAIGLYRIRKSDPWPSKEHPRDDARPNKKKGRRTFFNSEVRPYSWPCVYAFVSEWEEEERLAERDPSDVVPKSLFLPDGRVVPVCVIEVRQQAYATDLRVNPRNLLPRNLLGPGTPILNEDGQGMTKLATAGCLVRDGERYYVLTNSHAVGPKGTVLSALQSHRLLDIGVSAEKGITRQDFRAVYPHFASSNQYLLMDVGLIDLHDVTQWKTDFPGIAPVDTVLDLYDNSFNLHLVGMKVVGRAAVSGLTRGEIHGLFYRFKALAGSEYISDFIIGPETYGPEAEKKKEAKDKNVSFAVHHGDSGTLLFIEHELPTRAHASGDNHRPKTYHPFAVLWGKEEFLDGSERKAHPFALATAVSTALDQLNLDLVRDINLDQEYIWGWVGHYAIGGELPNALTLLESDKLSQFLKKNIGLLTIAPDQALGNDPRVLEKGAEDNSQPHFVQLADVPDNVWKSNVNFYQVAGPDGKKHRKPGPGSRGQADNPNHFADMDLPYQNFDTFLQFVLKDLETNLDPDIWMDYYNSVKPKYDAWAEALGKRSQPYAHWGALPFRVWQLFNAMVQTAGNSNQTDFLVAGGVLIHYVGDACQPLHTSYLSQGDPDRVVDRPRSSGKKLEADGVHSGYEDDMVNYGYNSENLEGRLNDEVKRQESDLKETIDDITTGKEAATAIIRLIASTHGTIAPREIVDKWLELHGTAKRDRNEEMWATFGPRTVTCMARGTRCLAKIWQGAWETGKGNSKIGAGSVQDEADLMARYNDPNVIPSLRLDKYKAILK